MHWTDEAIVLSARPHGEAALLVQLLTRHHGRHAGLVRGGQGRRARIAYETGNRLAVTWKARLAEHLGTVTGELLHGHAARFIEDGRRLACLAAAAALAEAALPEREAHPRAYDGARLLLAALDADHGWAAAYVGWELELLAELGFGLDLGSCAATGTRDGLAYVSPRSGQAVSRAAGAPYRERLLPLPEFLLPERAAGQGAGRGEAPDPADLLAGLALTGFFLERRVFAPHGRGLPPARSRFVDVLHRLVTISRG